MKLRNILFVLAMGLSILVSAQTYKLENSKVRFEIDSKGRLVSLKNLVADREYTKGGKGLWQIIYQEGSSLEEIITSEDVPVEVKKEGEKLIINYGGEFPVKVECTLDDDDIKFVPEIKNNSKDKILREFQFPNIQELILTKDSQYYTSATGGQAHDLRSYAMSGFTHYKWQDAKYVQKYILYPGVASLNCFLINEPNTALYFANYDTNFSKTLHMARLPNISKTGAKEYGLPALCMIKYPFLKSGESKKFPVYVVSPQMGDWHVAMKKYRKWAESTWYKKGPLAEDYRKSNGWQRVILRHQHGKILYKYSQLPDIYTAAEQADLKHLRLYGWWKEGMDSGNPQYSEDLEQGGDAELRKQIKAIQKRGGSVTLYFNGQLIDTSTEYYSKIGKDICVKRFEGFPDIETYPFGGNGTALRVFPYKTFAVACPYTKEWLERMKWMADRAISLGADGIYYDQMGHDVYPCCDKSHGHPVPFMDINKAKREMFQKVCEYVRSKKPDMPIGVEIVCEQISSLADYVHNSAWANRIVRMDKNGKPYMGFVPMYQYVYPEFSTCDLGFYDEQDIDKHLNNSLMRSWRSDVSVFRCRGTLHDTPNYKAYLKKINGLRERYRDLILNGKFRDTDLAECSSKKLPYYTYENGNKMAIVSTQAHLKKIDAEFVAKGYKYVEHSGLGNFKVEGEGDTVKTSIGERSVVVILFEKK